MLSLFCHFLGHYFSSERHPLVVGFGICGLGQPHLASRWRSQRGLGAAASGSPQSQRDGFGIWGSPSSPCWVLGELKPSKFISGMGSPPRGEQRDLGMRFLGARFLGRKLLGWFSLHSRNPAQTRSRQPSPFGVGYQTGAPHVPQHTRGSRCWWHLCHPPALSRCPLGFLSSGNWHLHPPSAHPNLAPRNWDVLLAPGKTKGFRGDFGAVLAARGVPGSSACSLGCASSAQPPG